MPPVLGRTASLRYRGYDGLQWVDCDLYARSSQRPVSVHMSHSPVNGLCWLLRGKGIAEQLTWF